MGKGLRSYCGFILFLYGAQLLSQPCPSIINCPQSTATYCDESSNDLSLWNYPPYTYSQTIGDVNLPEGEINLNIKVKGCPGGGITTISYILYLDLDNDGLQETVIMSGAPPSGGLVMANNSFNPGYSGGDTVRFDQRALPDSLRYRFTLETVYSGDTTSGWIRFSNDHAPYVYSPVILPEGRHRIEWRIVEDGVERFCDRNFKVKDCKKPIISCKSGLAVYLDISQTASISLLQALASVSDNITPDTQLVLGMRRVGSGFGFPMDPMGNPQDTAMFSCLNADIQFVEIWAKDKAGNLENCTAQVLVYDTLGVCPFLPLPSICARTYWNDQTIHGVSFSTSWTLQGQSPFINVLQVGQSGCAELDYLPPTSIFSLKAAKDSFPLNGVTTYDLVLISKNILGVEPFDAGWKIKAADANQSNSVTTFDIVELRKLILGLTTKLPNNTPSWLFFVDSCTAWNSPFYGICPTSYTLPVLPITSYPPNLSFKGLKMGDVNGSAASVDSLGGIAQTRGKVSMLELSDLSLQAGQTIDIPLRAVEGGQWEGLQLSLKFDPRLLEIESIRPAKGIDIGVENWAIPTAGVLNISWSDAMPAAVLPGDALLFLRVKAHFKVQLSEVLELSKFASIQPEVYDEIGTCHPLELSFSLKGDELVSINTQVFAPMPNPTTGSTRLPLRLNAAEQVSLEICDLSGKLIWQSKISLESGAHFLEIPAIAMPQSGVYIWRLGAESMSQSGRLVRL